jgi:hypothetical protein
VRVWDPAARAEIARHHGFSLLVRDVAVDPRGRRLAVAAWSDSLRGASSVVLDLLYRAKPP